MSTSRRTPEEIAKSLAAAKRIMAKEKLSEYKKSIRNAGIALLVVGILQVLIGLYEAFGPMKLMLGLYIDGGIGALFIGLFFWSKEKPETAFLTGLIVYILIMILMITIEPVSIFKGIIMKIIIIATLVSGMRAIKKVPKKIKSNDELLDEVQNPLGDL